MKVRKLTNPTPNNLEAAPRSPSTTQVRLIKNEDRIRSSFGMKTVYGLLMYSLWIYTAFTTKLLMRVDHALMPLRVDALAMVELTVWPLRAIKHYAYTHRARSIHYTSVSYVPMYLQSFLNRVQQIKTNGV